MEKKMEGLAPEEPSSRYGNTWNHQSLKACPSQQGATTGFPKTILDDVLYLQDVKKRVEQALQNVIAVIAWGWMSQHLQQVWKPSGNLAMENHHL